MHKWRGGSPNRSGMVLHYIRCSSTMYGVALRRGLDVQCDHAAADRLNRLFTASADHRVQ